MQKLWSSLKVEILLMHRVKWLYAPIFLSFLFIGYVTVIHTSRYEAGQAINNTAFLVQGGIFFFLIYGILLAREEATHHSFEVLLSITNGLYWKVSAKLLQILLVAIIISTGCLVVIMMLFLAYEVPGSILLDALLYGVLYWTFSFLIAGSAGLFLGYAFTNKMVYPVSILLGILIGPLNRISYVSLTKSLPKPLEAFMFMFNLGQSDPNRAYHLVYGFPMESFRWITKSMLLLICLILLAYAVYRKMHHTRTWTVSIGVFLSVSLLVTGCWKAFWPYVDDMTSTQAISEDKEYYVTQKALQQAKEPNFVVTRYELDVTLKHHLQNRAVLHILPNTDTTDLIFTLYHDLKVDHVRMKEKHLKFKQDGDHFVILSDQWFKKQQPYEIVVEYAGETPQRFFANDQAVMLPGTWPWYPVPGEQLVAEFVNKSMTRYYTNRTQNRPEYILRYDGPGPLHTNLTPQEKNTWSGASSSGVVLMAGALEELEVEHVEIVRPYALYHFSDDLSRDFQNWDNLSREIGDYLNTHTPPIQKVFLMETRMNDSQMWLEDGYAIFDVDLLSNSGLYFQDPDTLIQLLTGALARTYLWEKQDETMKRLFSSSVAYGITQEKQMVDPDQTYLKHHFPAIVRQDQKDIFQELLTFLDGASKDRAQLTAFHREWLSIMQSEKQCDWQAIGQLIDRHRKE